MATSTFGRMPFGIALSGLGLALALQALLSCSTSVDGRESFRRAREALKQTRSWRYNHMVRQFDSDTREERHVEVVCPSSQHMQGQFTYTAGSAPGSTYESYFLAGTSY